jgi:outer membrane protein TolC
LLTKSACFASLGFTGLCFTGCMVGPNYKRPDISIQGDWAPARSTQPDAVERTPPPLAWWATLKDPMLDSLVRRSWHGKLDVHIAKSRIWQSRALRNVATGGLYPNVDATGNYEFYRSQGPLAAVRDGDYEVAPVGFDAAWEVDVFGGVRRTVEAAQDDLDAQRDVARGVSVSLVAEVAREYVTLRRHSSVPPLPARTRIRGRYAGPRPAPAGRGAGQ